MEERKENMRRAPRKKVNWNEKKKEPISQEEAIQRVRERKEAAAVRKVMKELDPSPKEADLDDIYGLDATSHPPLLLVDGYNIALKHPDLKQLSEYGLWDDVRTTLAKRIAQFGEWTRTQVAIVWDAMGYAGDRGEQREHYEKYKNVTIIWSMNYEADTYIRRAARRINKDMPHVKIMVATGDTELSLEAEDAGASVIRPEQMLEQLKRVQRSGKDFLQKRKQQQKEERKQNRAHEAREEMEEVASEIYRNISYPGLLKLWNAVDYKNQETAAVATSKPGDLAGFKCLADKEEAESVGIDSKTFYERRERAAERQRRVQAALAEAGLSMPSVVDGQNHDRQPESQVSNQGP